ncbi:MAG TPA: hypothetical protein G4O00_10220 [Thermoflexia bacterium]|jgi:hypothetical protein|nr:hypothetical protein [Thermoflexia bacterium]
MGSVAMMVVWLLVTLLLIAGCTYPGPVEPTPTSAPAPAPVSLWDAYRRADATVRTEASDAELVSASTQWQAIDPDRLLETPSYWTFVFFSSSQRTVFDLTADADQVQVVNRTQIWSAPQILEPGRWQEGPRDALSIFLAYGGREFLEAHSEATVSLHLAANEDGKAIWSIAALDVATRETISLQIDAANLQVLTISP